MESSESKSIPSGEKKSQSTKEDLRQKSSGANQGDRFQEP